MSTLYIVATPIGNLDDISLRALKVLKEVSLILCEDTRRTKKLLNHFGISKATLSYHQHSRLKKIKKIINLLKDGKDLALVSDSGTPGISDPGNKLIEKIVESQKKITDPQKEAIEIVPIPGPSALITAASVSGFPMDKFLFLGFPPNKRKRNKFFSRIAESDYPVILYESPHRIFKTLNQIEETIEGCEIVVARELTKKFETIYRGKIKEVIKEIKEDKKKGEFTVIIKRRK